MTIEYDSITGRKYINSDVVSYNASFIASYNGETRFLQEDGTLVKVNQMPSIVSDNILTYYLGFGHAQIKLECESCNNGESYDFYHDLNGVLGNSTESFSATDTDRPLIIYLDDNQAEKIFESLLKIYELEQNKQYKYITLFHNCVSFLYDLWNISDINPYPFTYLLTDTELFKDSSEDIGMNAFTFNDYYPTVGSRI